VIPHAPPPPAGPAAPLSPAARTDRQRRDRDLAGIDFDRTPFTVIWEVTRACALACVHCRAEAQPRRDPRELTTDEGRALLDQVAAMGVPVFVVTGGDPLMRRDLEALVRHATARGLRPALAPSATALITDARMAALAEAGIRRVSFSIDGPDPASHDAFRGVPGSFAHTLRCLESVRRAGIGLQVNTTVSRYNLDRLEEIAALVEWEGAVQWSVVFLVPTGRGRLADMVSAEAHERVFHWLLELARRAPFDVKTTAAPAYRRVAIQHARPARDGAGQPGGTDPGPRLAGAGFRYADGLDRPAQGVNDARGFLFVSHVGDACPSGFLPLVAGNVRERPLAEIDRDAPLFRALRDPARLKGKCGACEFRVVCGGSRARAYAVSGDYLAEDPSCAYSPPGWGGPRA
jgi:radical SAM protein